MLQGESLDYQSLPHTVHATRYGALSCPCGTTR